MPEPIEWLDDGSAGGSPFSPRFGDRYRSELGGIGQARDVFLKGCGLPEAWAAQPRWTVLETGFGLGLNFLVTWQAWKNDPARPALLHFVSTEAFPASAADVLRGALAHPELMPLAEALQAQFHGLLPGVHRLVFEGGRVMLTLCIGDAKAWLREQRLVADSVYLDGFSPGVNPDIWDVHTFKAVARCCRRGTRVATWTIARAVRDALAQCGFVVRKVPGVPPKRDNLQGEYAPAWEPRARTAGAVDRREPAVPARCVVIGAGLAGASVAASLARRGWQVTVLDAAGPAAGASGLPAGVLAPHVSPDDGVISRLTRAGLRMTWQQCAALLTPGRDWAPTGVLEHGVDKPRRLPADWLPGRPLAAAAADWSQPAGADRLAACGLPPDAPAHWHAHAGWVVPGRLVAAWLGAAGVTVQGAAAAAGLQWRDGVWEVRDAGGHVLASAELVVLAAGPATAALAQAARDALQPGPGAAGAPSTVDVPVLRPVRGQVSYAYHADGAPPASAPSSWPPLAPDMPDTAVTPITPGQAALPPFPVNGHGSLIPDIEGPDGRRAWITGATYERGQPAPMVRPADETANLGKLRELLPAVASTLLDGTSAPRLHAWAGVRCATPNRLPVLGPLAAGLWVCSGLGSRGLSFSALCGEVLAAHLQGEPMPAEQKLVDAMLPTGVAPKR